MNLRNENGYQMQHSELYRRLGLDPKKHLPSEGVAATNIDGITVYVLPKGATSPITRERKYRGHTKRTFAICPSCDRHVEAGHFHQHLKTHKE